jgi:hypothetical protein
LNKDEFLTARWNNILSLVLGIPALAYAIVVLSTSVMSDFAGFIWLVGIGVVY